MVTRQIIKDHIEAVNKAYHTNIRYDAENGKIYLSNSEVGDTKTAPFLTKTAFRPTNTQQKNGETELYLFGHNNTEIDYCITLLEAGLRLASIRNGCFLQSV